MHTVCLFYPVNYSFQELFLFRLEMCSLGSQGASLNSLISLLSSITLLILGEFWRSDHWLHEFKLYDESGNLLPIGLLEFLTVVTLLLMVF